MLDPCAYRRELICVFECCVLTQFTLLQRAHGFLNCSAGRQYSRDVALGLQHFHRHGVAHRDISIQNILRSAQEGVCKAGDLGLAASSFVLERMVTSAWYSAPAAWVNMTKFEKWQGAWTYGLSEFLLSRCLLGHMCAVLCLFGHRASGIPRVGPLMG